MTEHDLQQRIEIAARLAAVRERIAAAAARAGRRAEEIKLVAVSKTQPVDMIAAAVAAGAREFGENKAQELRDKMPQFGPEINWHFIGRLQTNKVKYVVPGACLIHSLDRLDLASALDRHAERAGAAVAALIEVNTSGEASKAGLLPAELPDFPVAFLADPIIQVSLADFPGGCLQPF
jgi:pyridoxal phosphate enzyme (YggS family)